MARKVVFGEYKGVYQVPSPLPILGSGVEVVALDAAVLAGVMMGGKMVAAVGMAAVGVVVDGGGVAADVVADVVVILVAAIEGVTHVVMVAVGVVIF